MDLPLAHNSRSSLDPEVYGDPKYWDWSQTPALRDSPALSIEVSQGPIQEGSLGRASQNGPGEEVPNNNEVGQVQHGSCSAGEPHGILESQGSTAWSQASSTYDPEAPVKGTFEADGSRRIGEVPGGECKILIDCLFARTRLGGGSAAAKQAVCVHPRTLFLRGWCCRSVEESGIRRFSRGGGMAKEDERDLPV